MKSVTVTGHVVSACALGLGDLPMLLPINQPRVNWLHRAVADLSPAS